MAELILTLHFLFILFLVVGFPIGLTINHRLFRIVHASFLAGITLLMVSGIPCPLTVLEEVYRDSAYGGSFLATWLQRIIYLTWVDTFHVFLIDLGFAVLVFSSFIWRPLRPTEEKHANTSNIS